MKHQCNYSGIEFESRSNTHLDGMRFCLDLIQELREEYAATGNLGYDLPIEKVLDDVEYKIGVRAYPHFKGR